MYFQIYKIKNAALVLHQSSVHALAIANNIQGFPLRQP
jgi:hypothetical protein